MVRRAFRPEQIVNKLREAEILLSQGATVAEASRKIGVTEQTYYRWRREYGGMRVEQAKRLKELEDIADSFKGVEKSYAIQAGREVRILVSPEEIDDLGAMRLARDIVKKIEESLQFPGQIKVTVLRETRAVDYAK